ncbi:unnamed protein product [Strongylus vulgaris]|uniref:Uncharacterized protein n=1 Tax=Strongylus vulgaris TaxID=40348 RepID=A0A3P7II05_STRVU|nr:unnamed protein product [Strongylus vulgaris]
MLVSNYVTPTGELPVRILSARVRAAIQMMKTTTSPGPDLFSPDLLRAGGNRLHKILTANLALPSERNPDQWGTWNNTPSKEGRREGSSVQYACLACSISSLRRFSPHIKALDEA